MHLILGIAIHPAVFIHMLQWSLLFHSLRHRENIPEFGMLKEIFSRLEELPMLIGKCKLVFHKVVHQVSSVYPLMVFHSWNVDLLLKFCLTVSTMSFIGPDVQTRVPFLMQDC